MGKVAGLGPVDVQVVHVLDVENIPLAAHAWPCEVRRERARALSAGLSALREQLADRDFPKVGPRFTTFGTASDGETCSKMRVCGSKAALVRLCLF